MAHRRGAFAALVVAVLIAVVAVVLVRGSDEEIRVRSGAASVGFPVRGGLAGDRDLQREAAASWRRRATRDGGSWAGDGAGVSTLWAGRLDDDEVGVVLLARDETAFLTRSDRDADDDRPYWEVSEGRVRSLGPGVIAFADAVLVRADARAEFKPAVEEAEGSPRLREDDGLWHRGGIGLPPGALVQAQGIPGPYGTRRTGPIAVFTGDKPAVRELSADLARRLASGPESVVGAHAQRLLTAAQAGTSERDRPGTPVNPFPLVALAGERETAPFGTVLVLATSTRAGAASAGDTDRPVLSAGIGGEQPNAKEATGVKLGGDESADDRATDGLGFGGAYVRRGEGRSYLLLASAPGVRDAEVLAGTRRIAVPSPVGAVPATWLDPDPSVTAPATDVLVLARDAEGTVVVPSLASGVRDGG